MAFELVLEYSLITAVECAFDLGEITLTLMFLVVVVCQDSCASVLGGLAFDVEHLKLADEKRMRVRDSKILA